MWEDLQALLGTLYVLLSKPMSRLVYWLYLGFVMILVGSSQILDSIWIYFGNQSLFSGSTQLSQNLFSFYIAIFVSFFFIFNQKIKTQGGDDKDYGQGAIYIILGIVLLISIVLILKFSLPSWLGWIFYVISLICWTISISDDEFLTSKLNKLKINSANQGGFTNQI